MKRSQGGRSARWLLIGFILAGPAEGRSTQTAYDADVVARSVLAASRARSLAARSEWGREEAARIRAGSVYDPATTARLVDRSSSERQTGGLPAAGFTKRLDQRSEFSGVRMKEIQRRSEPRPPQATDTGAAFQDRIQKRSDPAAWGALAQSMKSSVRGGVARQQLQIRSVYDARQLERVRQLSTGADRR